MKRLFMVSFLTIFITTGCSFLCRIPEEVKRSEELQYKQAIRINFYLKEVNKNPQILTDPEYERLNKAILEASGSLVESIKALSDYLGHTEEFKKEQELKGGNQDEK